MTNTDEAVAQFKARWEFADEQGMEGSRVAYALEPLLTALEAAEAELVRLREIVLSGTTPGDTGTIYLDPEKTLDQVWDALNGVPGSAPVSSEAHCARYCCKHCLTDEYSPFCFVLSEGEQHILPCAKCREEALKDQE